MQASKISKIYYLFPKLCFLSANKLKLSELRPFTANIASLLKVRSYPTRLCGVFDRSFFQGINPHLPRRRKLSCYSHL